MKFFFFERAFRPFFLGGALFAVIGMLVWFLNYPSAALNFSGISPLYWHAHEMVFGYALATVTGFLLTAVMNWSRGSSASGWPLAWLFALWVGARAGYLFDLPLLWIAVMDLGFTLGLFLHFFWPVVRKKLRQQIGLTMKFGLLILANAVFYAGALGWLENGERTGVLLGLFLVLAINLTMMRRLMPFFTEKALQLPDFKQSKWLDGFAIGGFLALMILAVWWPVSWMTAVTGFLLAIVHGLRWIRWYHPGIWKIVLIWPLYLSYGFMIVGMGLFGFVGLGWLTPTVAVHALAAGGIGLLCSAIMARISLGHTNRNVFEPPKAVFWVFVILALNGVVRVVLPVVDPQHYGLWIHVSQLGWVLAFTVLIWAYWNILTRLSPHKPGLNLL